MKSGKQFNATKYLDPTIYKHIATRSNQIVDSLTGWIQEQHPHHLSHQLEATSLQETLECQYHPVSSVAEGAIRVYTFDGKGLGLILGHSQICNLRIQLRDQGHPQVHRKLPGGSCLVPVYHGDTSRRM